MQPEAIEEIRYWHRQRIFAMDQRKRADMALGAFLRTQLGWSRDLPEKERKQIATQAADLIAIGEKEAKGNPLEIDEPAYDEWRLVIGASIMARTPFNQIEAQALKEMSRLAQTLPVWGKFGEEVRGFGPASLAVVVGEAGDLSNYATHSKLWKRMGVAVVGDVRQGGLRKGATAEDWITHGYSPARRSRLWNIGDALIKGNRDGKYREAYLKRKAYEVERDPEMKLIHAHRRAQRYMEKRLLRDLWRAWREAINGTPETATLYLPPANIAA